MTAGYWWNPPPNWPPAPLGWSPPPGWQPPPDWPLPPAGWSFWLVAGTSPTPRPAVARRSNANVGVIVGAGVLTISPGLTWIHVLLLGDLNLFNLTSLSENNATWFPSVIVLLGVGLIVLGLLRSVVGYALALTAGVLGGIVGVLVVIGFVRAIREDEGLVTLGIGPWAALLGLGVVVISSIVGLVATG